MLGLGLSLTNFGTRGGVVDTPDLSGSSAAAFLALWSTDGQGLVMDFADDQSIKITDTSTPANDIDSSGIVSSGALVGPGASLTYTSPSTKLTLQSTGYYARQAHNLYLNSASPANQSVTVVSGATYRMTITGSVSIAVSGAATGTYTAGDNDFTAATTTLTCGSTSGSGTVHLRRTPSNSDYVATAGSSVYALPYEWNTSGLCQGIRVEESRTNLCLYSNDLTNAAWTKSNMSTAKTATGYDNVANSATTLTATAANATALQAITSASAARITHCAIKRRTGSGNIDLTQDNGSTWTTQSITDSWAIYELSSVTSANPTVGIRIVTSGDAVDVMYFQHSTGAFRTSPIETFASSVTRAADNLSATDVVSFLTGPRTQFVSACVISYKTNINFLSVNNSASGEQSRSEIYYPYATSARSIMRDVAGSTIANDNLSITTIASPRVIKEAAVYATDDMIFAVDGTTSAADTTGTIGTNANKIWIGRNYSGINGACYIKSVAIFPERISNANLQSMTT